MNTAGTGTGTAGTGTAGTGAGTAGSNTGTGGMTGVQLQSPNYFVKLSGADAAPGAAAPAAYMNAACASCHGANGEGVASIGPEIRFTPKAYAVAVVRNGRKTPANAASAMIAFPTTTLSDADLDSINTWQNSFTKPTTGQGLYTAMCGNCHGPMTPTGGSAPIAIQGKSKADVAMYVRNGNGTDLAMRTSYMPAFDTTLLSETELDLIQTFLGSTM
jgi:mono/diheme cytochrome c family protein